MSDRFRVFFTGECDGYDKLREALAESGELEVVGWQPQVVQAATPLTGGHIDCVVHATRSAMFPAGETATIREYTRAPIILVVSGGEATAMLEQALDQGVADVLLLPQLAQNVVFSIRKAAHVRTQLQAPVRHGRVVTVFSPKGGTGKTVVATNVAARLAKHEAKRTLLLDLDLQFGDAAIMLGIEPLKTIYDLVVAPGELDSEKLEGYVTKHPCGLDVLAAPLRPEDAELVLEGKVTGLLDVARSSYDAIIVDTSPFFHGGVLATLDRTDELLVLCGLDVPTLKNVRLALQTLEQLSFPPSRISYVMNRASANVGLKTSEVEDGLKVKVRHELPTDRAVQLCVNRGEAVVLAEPRSEFAKAVAGLARDVAPKTDVPAAAPERRRRLSLARA
ncbi:MAG TPA: AAA family ATPase [Gaiellaceae bacterium]|nr:AAA family ATPase [Gaiellaceae bacterium]HUJ56659.1 AAA family ATPase [Gaiellaceae bacterium]